MNQEFIRYCMSFYGDVKDTLGYFRHWGYDPMEEWEITSVLPKIEKIYPSEVKDGKIIVGDTHTRELVRDFVIMGRGIDVRTEMNVTQEAIEKWKENRERWRKQLENQTKNKNMSHSEKQELWLKITSEGYIKPSWFGFLRK